MVDRLRKEKLCFAKNKQYTNDVSGDPNANYKIMLKKILLSSFDTFNLINEGELDNEGRKAISQVLVKHVLDQNKK